MKVSISTKIEVVWNSMRQGPAGDVVSHFIIFFGFWCGSPASRESTRENAEGCGAFMGESERLYAKATYSSGSPTEQWTVVALHLGGWGQGREVSPPAKAGPGARWNRAGGASQPPNRDVFMKFR